MSSVGGAGLPELGYEEAQGHNIPVITASVDRQRVGEGGLHAQRRQEIGRIGPDLQEWQNNGVLVWSWRRGQATLYPLPVRFRDVMKLIEADGWQHARTTGSHLHFKHPTKPGVVTIPGGGKPSRDVPPGTLRSILKQAGLN